MKNNVLLSIIAKFKLKGTNERVCSNNVLKYVKYKDRWLLYGETFVAVSRYGLNSAGIPRIRLDYVRIIAEKTGYSDKVIRGTINSNQNTKKSRHIFIEYSKLVEAHIKTLALKDRERLLPYLKNLQKRLAADNVKVTTNGQILTPN